MPYRRTGRIIYHKVGDKWKIKQRCKDVESAKKAFGLLQGLAHGSIKPSDVGKGKYA